MSGLPADLILDEMIKEGEDGLREKLPVNYIPYATPQPGRPEDSDDGDNDSYKTKPSDPDSKREGK
jgi:hypothetical protein